MSWFKTDDEFFDNPKVRQLEQEDPRTWANCVALWFRVGVYCSRHLTDGRVTRRQLVRLTPLLPRTVLRAMAHIVNAGLWRLEEEGQVIVVHDYLDYNPSRADVLRERARWAAFKAKERSGSAKSGAKSGAKSRTNLVPDLAPKVVPKVEAETEENQGHTENVHGGQLAGVHSGVQGLPYPIPYIRDHVVVDRAREGTRDLDAEAFERILVNEHKCRWVPAKWAPLVSQLAPFSRQELDHAWAAAREQTTSGRPVQVGLVVRILEGARMAAEAPAQPTPLRPLGSSPPRALAPTQRAQRRASFRDQDLEESLRFAQEQRARDREQGGR